MKLKDLEKSILGLTKYTPVEGKRISASEMGSDMLQLYYRRKHTVEPTDVGQNTIGSLVHLGLEHLDIDSEVKISKIIPGTDIVATATVDAILEDSIIDYKTSKVYAVSMLRTAIKKLDYSHNYIMQLNHIAWILDYPDKKYYCVFFNKDAGMDFKSGKIKPTYEIVEVPIMEPAEYLALVQAKAKELYIFVDEDREPPICKDLWIRKIAGVATPMKCLAYCDYSKICSKFKPTVLNETVNW